MSINNLTSYNTLTIDGLDNVNIDGSPFDPNNYVSKINPISQTMSGNLDFGLNKVKSSSSPSDLDDLTNKNYVDIQDNNIINNISNNYLNKTTTSAQSIASKITFNKEVEVLNNKKTNISSKVIVDSNYKSNLTSASITTTQNLSTITNVGIVYQTSTTSTNQGILNLFPIIYNNRYNFSIELLGGYGSTNTYLQTSQSQDGINPSNIIDVRIFPNGSTAFETLNYTFEASVSGNIIIEISTDDPSGITGLKWKNFNTYDMGVYISNITTNLTASKIPIINDKQQLISSGVDSIKIDYLDNLSSDIQMQLNNKANLSGGNTFTGTQTYSDQTASRVAIYDSSKALVSSSITTTTLSYLDVNSSIQTQLNSKANTSALANYLPLSGGILSGPLTISSGALTANSRLLGVPDAVSGGNFWIGLTGSDSETNRLAISVIGDQTTGTCSGVSISKPLNMGTNKITTTYSATNAEDVINVSTLQTALGNYIARTGDTGLSGNYVTSGYFTGSAMISNSFYGPQFSQLYQKANDTDKWFKIIQLGNGGPTTNGTLMASGEFVITYSVAGNHGFIYFSAGVSYNATPFIKIEKSIIYGSAIITELRLATNDTSIYYNAYVEMKTAPTVNWYSNNITVRVYQVNEAPLDAPSYITVLQSKTPGSTTGYTYYNVLCETAFDINRDNRRFYLAGTQAYMGGVRFDVAGGLRGLGNGGGGGGGDIWMENISSASNAYAVMYLRTNAGGCYWFMNSSNRTDDGGINTATLRNDNGSLRLQGQGASGTFQVWSNGVCNVHANDGGAFGYSLSTPGALVIGSTLKDFGGWQANLLLECANNAEIVVHDSGTRLTSIAYYEGANNRIYIGRDLGSGWGTASVQFPDRITVGGTMSNGKINVVNPNGSYTHLGWTDNCNYLRGVVTYVDTMLTCNSTVNFSSSQPVNFGSYALGSPDANNNPYGNVSTWGAGKSNWTGYSIKQNYSLMNYAFNDEVGFHSRIYSWLWYSTGATRDIVLAGSGRFSQDWDRLLVYANGVNTGGGYFYYNQGNAYGTISDRRIKKDFQRVPAEQSIEFIKALEPTSFCLKEQKPCCIKNPDGVEEMKEQPVCSCRQDGWVAQNVLEACKISGASKSVVNNWYDYEQELLKPEEERTTLIGVSDRPILSHTVNAVKALIEKVEILEQRNQILSERSEILESHARKQENDFNDLSRSFEEYKKLTEERFNTLVNILLTSKSSK